MKAHRVVLFVLDVDNIGAAGIKDVLENTKYPNRCISPDVKSVETVDIGEWHDNHPLNLYNTQAAEYRRLFPNPPDDPGPVSG